MKDYFECQNELPEEVKSIVDRYNELYETMDAYSLCSQMEKELIEVGWVMDWGLDGTPTDLQPIDAQQIARAQ